MSRMKLISILRPVEWAAAELNLALHDAAREADTYAAGMRRRRGPQAVASTRRAAA